MSDGPTWPTNDEGSGANPPAGGEGAAPPPSTTPPPEQGAAPPPPPPPAPEAPTGAGQMVDLGPRLGARLIDMVLLWIVSLIIVVPLVIGAMFTDAGTNAAFGGGFGFSLGGFIGQVVAAVIYVGYFAWLESSRGQTLGKQLLKLRVVGPDGANPTMEQAIRRNLWLAAGVIPVIGGLIGLGLAIWIMVSISSNADNHGIHDEWGGGTRVVRA